MALGEALPESRAAVVGRTWRVLRPPLRRAGRPRQSRRGKVGDAGRAGGTEQEHTARPSHPAATPLCPNLTPYALTTVVPLPPHSCSCGMLPGPQER